MIKVKIEGLRTTEEGLFALKRETGARVSLMRASRSAQNFTANIARVK